MSEAEDELNRIRAISDWHIPKANALQLSLQSLDSVLKTLTEAEEAWQGESGDAMRARVTDLRAKFDEVKGHVSTISTSVDAANTARRTAMGAELPSGEVDPFWENAVKGASVVVHPILGPIAADKALDVIGDFLGG